MNHIYIDPSEAKENTRLHQNVIQASCVLNRLEEYTGADLLLSPLSLPMKPLGDETSLKLLHRHIEAGLLIQRKSGRDAVNSIPHYPAIQQRMMEWSSHPLLLVVGEYGSSRESKVVVDGHETEWSWNAYTAAIDWWELRGGIYFNLSRDGQMLQYLNQWLERLASDEWNDGTTKKVVNGRVPKQVLGKPSWTSFLPLMGIGFGTDKLEWVEQNFSGLADFLCYFSEEENLKSELVGQGRGIGKSHFVKVRNLLGLEKEWAMARYCTREIEEAEV